MYTSINYPTEVKWNWLDCNEFCHNWKMRFCDLFCTHGIHQAFYTLNRVCSSSLQTYICNSILNLIIKQYNRERYIHEVILVDLSWWISNQFISLVRHCWKNWWQKISIVIKCVTKLPIRTRNRSSASQLQLTKWT